MDWEFRGMAISPNVVSTITTEPSELWELLAGEHLRFAV